VLNFEGGGIIVVVDIESYPFFYVKVNSSHHHHKHSANCQHQHVNAAAGRLGFAFFINFIFALIELIGGYLVNSIAVQTDAVHDFGDSIILGIAWYLEKKSIQKSDSSFSYGYRRLSTFSALFAGVILIAGSLYMFIESVQRFNAPVEPNGLGMLALAVLGIAVNGMAYFRMSSGKSLNEKVITWHFLEDLLGWVLVFIGSVLVLFFKLTWVDPLLGIVLSVWIVRNVFKNIKYTTHILLQRAPESFTIEQVHEGILSINGVKQVHHAHVWSLDGEKHIFTAHIVTSLLSLRDLESVKRNIKSVLKEKFSIHEATLEFENDQENCDDPEHV
jgi:cobalt-zinc-cadmium efflux system protein